MEGKEFNVTVALDQRLGQDGKSAYELWKEQGNEGSVADFLAKLKGEPGKAGKSAYELWVEQGNTGSVADYLAKLKGEKGDAGKVTTRTITLESTAWDPTGTGRISVAVDGVTAENTIIVSPSLSRAATMAIPTSICRRNKGGPAGPSEVWPGTRVGAY